MNFWSPNRQSVHWISNHVVRPDPRLHLRPVHPWEAFFRPEAFHVRLPHHFRLLPLLTSARASRTDWSEDPDVPEARLVHFGPLLCKLGPNAIKLLLNLTKRLIHTISIWCVRLWQMVAFPPILEIFYFSTAHTSAAAVCIKRSLCESAIRRTSLRLKQI